ncbi:GatB/YqeY domain-containing protein [Tyzzerella sp. An114]|uniref:GatB/YqeY domain-containing protein n=1 Tax=Tyzzerella sp. An114 TaxID=1965545 RepID=UPI002E8E3AB7|nr:GatB/YqeY domain-containing protein [Tyzzerella sp. An114]
MTIMSLKERLLQDMKDAMKAKDTVRKNTVQLVRSGVLQIEKDKKIELDDEGVLDVIAKELKKRRDSLPEFEKSGRTDLIENLNKEIEVLLGYLPEQLTEEEIQVIVDETIKEVQAESMKDMGKVMAAVTPKVKGRADNKIVSNYVKKLLQK